MGRTLHIGVFVAAFFGIAGAALAAEHGDSKPVNGEVVRVLSSRDIVEKLDGKDAKATIVEVTIGPGQSGLAHRHPGPGLVYVLEGEYELGVDDKPTEIFKAGETFYEPTGCLHRVSRNPSTKTRTRLIAVVLHPRDVCEIATPVGKGHGDGAKATH
jgi:quercetin dioxygenase-like cupin family protein